MTQYNQTYGNRAKLIIPGLSTTLFYLQRFSLPGISMGHAIQPTSFVDVPIPGDKIVFEPLKLDIMLDEGLNSYTQIFDWIVGLGFPSRFEEFQDKPFDRQDGTVIFVSNHLNPTDKKIKFYELFPVSISEVPYDYTEGDATPRTFSVTFLYTRYAFVNE